LALDLVAAGRGLLVAPRLLVASVRSPDVRFIPLELGGPLHLTYALVWRDRDAGASLTTLVQTVQGLLRIR
jgi:DNA-binding transcriptional LysR family regulator